MIFHGGGWVGGTRGCHRYLCEYFASRGLVAATASYRVPVKRKTSADKRMGVIDAKSAIRWFKKNAAELGVDPNHIITGGDSAGGHISMLAALNTNLDDPTDPEGIDTSVVAYIGYNPAFTEHDKPYPEVDVLAHLSNGFPPSIILFGDQDPWLKGWNAVHEKLKEMDVKNVEVKIAKNEGHAFWIYQPWSDIMLIEADKFLTKLGLLEGEPTLKMPTTGEKMVSMP
jgi:acetyl esterase/lipase